MRKPGFEIFIGVLLIIFVSSCLTSGDGPITPTEKEEQMELAAYLKTLTEKGYDIDTTDLGIYYITLEKGEGEFPKSGDSLSVGYAGYFIDGTLFDASDKHEENGLLNFVLGAPPLINGWDDGMKVINKNARVQLIIPSEFAYGSTGAGNIPPFKTLVFVINMVEIWPS